MKCLLCESPQTTVFSVTKKPARHYFHCESCELIFMEPQERPLPQEEKTRYDLHQNEDSSGYRRFLEPLVQEIQQHAERVGTLASELKILDYGCGPTAFLASLLSEHSLRTANYDPFYFSDQKPLQTDYDIITSTEVWEHFHHPLEEITQLTKILRPSGMLAVMTAAHPGVALFADWQYRRDLTHVIFFNEKTMRWIAAHFNLDLIKAQTPYWIFQKKMSPP